MSNRDDKSSLRVGPPLVLIVDDEGPIAQALAFIVEDAGYTPMTALHGQQALEYASQYHPALVFTDLMMPQMDGAEFIARLRAKLGVEHMPPIILMSAAHRQYSELVGADMFLPKPFEVEEVENLLHKYLEPES